jgi:hypothetical protein
MVEVVRQTEGLSAWAEPDKRALLRLAREDLSAYLREATDEEKARATKDLRRVQEALGTAGPL